jgi:hypothetical protein
MADRNFAIDNTKFLNLIDIQDKKLKIETRDSSHPGQGTANKTREEVSIRYRAKLIYAHVERRDGQLTHRVLSVRLSDMNKYSPCEDPTAISYEEGGLPPSTL